MHILLFSEIDPLYSEKNRFHWLWEALQKEHTVTVFALRDLSKMERKYAAPEESVRYLNDTATSPTWVEAFPKRALACMRKVHAAEPFDMIFSYNGLRLSTKLRQAFPNIPFWYDLCDDLADLAASSPLLPRVLAPLVRQVAKYYVQQNCILADRVITTTPLLLEHYACAPKNMSVVPNGYQWPASPPPLSLPPKAENEQWITFVGAIREWVNLQEVIKSMDLWPQGWRLVIAGNEGQLKEVKEYARDFNVYDRIHFLGHIPHSSLPHLLECSDVGIIPFKKNSTTDLAVTLKLMEYMSCGLPVVSKPLQATEAMFGKHIHLVHGTDWKTSIEQALHDHRDTRVVVQEYTWDSLLSSILKELPN